MEVITNYQETKEILNALSKYLDVSKLEISTKNSDWKGREYESDLVHVIKDSGITFEVFENEIIVYFLKDHIHFYKMDDNEDVTYLARTIEFFEQLFTCKVVREEYYKGKALICNKHKLIYPDGKIVDDLGVTYYGFLHLINPFLKKKKVVTVWRFDKETATFLEDKV